MDVGLTDEGKGPVAFLRREGQLTRKGEIQFLVCGE
jgi:hypothetical protein